MRASSCLVQDFCVRRAPLALSDHLGHRWRSEGERDGFILKPVSQYSATAQRVFKALAKASALRICGRLEKEDGDEELVYCCYS